MFERNTVISSKVLEILESANNPLSVAHILESLHSQSLSPNKATVYRILKKLINKNAISEISVRNGVSFYEMAHPHHPHHHFICNDCHTVFCLKDCHVESQNINLEQLFPNKNFVVHSLDFNLYGVCEPCLKGQ